MKADTSSAAASLIFLPLKASLPTHPFSLKASERGCRSKGLG